MLKRYRFIWSFITLTWLVLTLYFIGEGPAFVMSLTALSVTLFLAGLTHLSHRSKADFYHRIEADNERLQRDIKRKDQLQQNVLEHHPTGVILLGEKNTIVWANATAKKIYNSPLEDRALDIIDKELVEVVENVSAESTTLKIYGHYYDVTHLESLKALYLNNVHEREILRQISYQQVPVIGMLHFDNLEDAFSVLDMQEKSVLQGIYLGAVDDWAEAFELNLVAVSSSRLAFFATQQQLKKLIENDFSILETIKALSQANELMITLSGGIACASLPPYQLGINAEAALDLALSRGGDQLVVNVEGEAMQVFGGNTNMQEKRTRISSRMNAQKLHQLLLQTNRVFIVPHVYPDTDALGGAMGVLKMALAMNKEAFIVIDETHVDKSVRKILTQTEYEYVTLFETLLDADEALVEMEPDDALILVDHHSLGQLLEPKLLQKTNHVAIIDHHRKLQDRIMDVAMSYIEPYASSSTELIVEMISVFPEEVTLNPFEATVMLSGIIVDTNNFMYRTGSRTYEAAATLRRFGADSFKVKNILRESLTEIQLKSRLLTQAEVIHKRYAVVVIPDDVSVDRTLLAKVADALLTIDRIVAGFAIGQLGKGEVGISARSLDEFNVQVAMEKWGGGGHLNNAAAQVSLTKEALKKELLNYLETTAMEEKPMKVILLKDLKNRGKKDDIIEVPAGFGNYLLTSKQAIEATAENVSSIELQKQKLKDNAQAELEAMKSLKSQLDHQVIKLSVKMGEKGKLYGKLTTKHLAEALQDQLSLDIDKRKIQLPDKIEALGSYTVEVKLHKDVLATFELQVVEAV